MHFLSSSWFRQLYRIIPFNDRSAKEVQEIFENRSCSQICCVWKYERSSFALLIKQLTIVISVKLNVLFQGSLRRRTRKIWCLIRILAHSRARSILKEWNPEPENTMKNLILWCCKTSSRSYINSVLRNETVDRCRISSSFVEEAWDEHGPFA